MNSSILGYTNIVVAIHETMSVGCSSNHMAMVKFMVIVIASVLISQLLIENSRLFVDS